jgi:hypothetical protein
MERDHSTSRASASICGYRPLLFSRCRAGRTATAQPPTFKPTFGRRTLAAKPAVRMVEALSSFLPQRSLRDTEGNQQSSVSSPLLPLDFLSSSVSLCGKKKGRMKAVRRGCAAAGKTPNAQSSTFKPTVWLSRFGCETGGPDGRTPFFLFYHRGPRADCFARHCSLPVVSLFLNRRKRRQRRRTPGRLDRGKAAEQLQ